MEVGRNKDRAGTETLRSTRGHGGANAEPPGLVRGGAHDGTISAPRDDDRFAAQTRVVTLFDGSVERVHIDVHDLSKRRLRVRSEFDLVSLHKEGSRRRRPPPQLQNRASILCEL